MSRRTPLFFFVLSVVPFFGAVLPAAAEVVERILAVVNDEIVTEQDL